MLGAAMHAPLSGLAFILDLTHGGFPVMIPMIAAAVLATATARRIDGYSIYTARLRAHPVRAAPISLPERRTSSGRAVRALGLLAPSSRRP
jgi:H+/Cl- antiporter ClcA